MAGQRKIPILALSICCCFVFSSSVFSKATRDTSSLINLKGVYILIEMHPTVMQIGLQESQVASVLDSKLKKAGMKKLTMEEMLTTLGAPVLYVNFNAFKVPGIAAYSYNLKLELKQMCKLMRDNSLTPYAVTWAAPSQAGVVNTSEFIEKMLSTLEQYSDLFVNDYSKANSAGEK